MRRPFRHRGPLAGGRVPRPDEHAHLRDRRIERPDLRERPLEVLLDVVGEGAQRRDVEDMRFVGERRALSDERIARREKSGQRLSRARGRGDQAVAAFADRRPALALRGRRLAQAIGEPRGDGGMEGVQGRHKRE